METLETTWVVRPATTRDLDFLKLMLYEAAFWQPGQRRLPFHLALGIPQYARYLKKWGRRGDTAVIALDADFNPIGAAWYRLFTRDDAGYGFVDEATPEVTVAVSPAYRGRGVGTALLNALIARARAARFHALSLSVEESNPARHLYERLGFTRVAQNGNAWTMRLDLSAKKANLR